VKKSSSTAPVDFDFVELYCTVHKQKTKTFVHTVLYIRNTGTEYQGFRFSAHCTVMHITKNRKKLLFYSIIGVVLVLCNGLIYIFRQ
jgi:hypothetical protein